MQKYKTIVIDPPWKYGVWGKPSDSPLARKKFPNGQWQKDYVIPYDTMTVQQIKNLKVNELAAEDCELYLWTTQKYLPDAFEVIKSWDFKYCQTLTWCKTPMGTGQGGVYCPTTEFIILARKGKMPKVSRINTTWWNIKRTSVHSRKPEFFQDLIESVSDSPRLEMFARRKRLGWDVWGNEVDCDIAIDCP